ncbi:hypothetical protein [Azospirillum tabaci]|uniref:hypothetical protein n=1 Tax=Azospirillum tabaci TaxID=2752310 RepID=UPI001660E537|nr:hypothetical protein [Azospirillum tabaci]
MLVPPTPCAAQVAGPPIALPTDRMPEAEVALRLAFHLLDQPGSDGHAEVAIDGAMVRIAGRDIFPLAAFLAATGWQQAERSPNAGNAWQGRYRRGNHALTVHARSGVGDVMARVGTRRIRAECKGGPLVPRKGSPEYPILQKAIGQVVTIEAVAPEDLIVVGVPATSRFAALRERWKDRPLFAGTDVRIALVGRDGHVDGLEDLAP